MIQEYLADTAQIIALAIEASKKEERKPCEYCDGNEKNLLHHGGDMARVECELGMLNIEFTGYDERLGDRIQINFCPMCGRKLDVEK